MEFVQRLAELPRTRWITHTEEVKVKRHEDIDELEQNKVVQLERDKRPVHQRSTVTSLL